MAYSAPELLLVGAAQNLVLAGGSNVTVVGKVDCQSRGEPELDHPDIYDDTGLW